MSAPAGSGRRSSTDVEQLGVELDDDLRRAGPGRRDVAREGQRAAAEVQRPERPRPPARTASRTCPMRRTYSKKRRVGSSGSTCDCAVPSTSSVSPDGEKTSASNSMRGCAMPASCHAAARRRPAQTRAAAAVRPDPNRRGLAGYTRVRRTNQESTGHGAPIRHIVNLCAPRPTMPSYCGRLRVPGFMTSSIRIRLRGTTLRYRQ